MFQSNINNWLISYGDPVISGRYTSTDYSSWNYSLSSYRNYSDYMSYGSDICSYFSYLFSSNTLSNIGNLFGTAAIVTDLANSDYRNASVRFASIAGSSTATTIVGYSALALGGSMVVAWGFAVSVGKWIY